MNDDLLKVDELFTDNDPINIVALVDSLKNFLRIKRDTNDIFLTQDGNRANALKKILIYGLGKKIIKIKGQIDKDSLSAKEVAEKLMLKKGTVDSSFSILRSKGYIMGSGSDYTIPNYKIDEVLEFLDKK